MLYSIISIVGILLAPVHAVPQSGSIIVITGDLPPRTSTTSLTQSSPTFSTSSTQEDDASSTLSTTLSQSTSLSISQSTSISSEEPIVSSEAPTVSSVAPIATSLPSPEAPIPEVTMPEAPMDTSLPSPQPCNNSPLLCNRAYNNVTYLGAHNSAFARNYPANREMGANQDFDTVAALSAGVRLLTTPVYLDRGDDDLVMCHGACSMVRPQGSLSNWLTLIREWLDANPNEVVTIVLNNQDAVDAELFDLHFRQSGIKKYRYTPPGLSAPAVQHWPTLAELIEHDTRLVTFIRARRSISGNLDYLLDASEFIVETPLRVHYPPAKFTCNPEGPKQFPSAGEAIDAGFLARLNHFSLTELIPGTDLTTVNERDLENINNSSDDGKIPTALGSHARECQNNWGGHKPVFVVVDFFTRGSAIDTVDRLNGVEGTVVGRTKLKSPDEENGASALFASGD